MEACATEGTLLLTDADMREGGIKSSYYVSKPKNDKIRFLLYFLIKMLANVFILGL